MTAKATPSIPLISGKLNRYSIALDGTACLTGNAVLALRLVEKTIIPQ